MSNRLNSTDEQHTTQRRCSEQELEEYIAVLRAWAAGEEIEMQWQHSGEWIRRSVPHSALDPFGQTKYRVKPKPVTRRK